MNKMNVFMILILSPLGVRIYWTRYGWRHNSYRFWLYRSNFLAIMGILYYPIKRFLKIRKEKEMPDRQFKNKMAQNELRLKSLNLYCGC